MGKPERLLAKVLRVATRRGDLVLDPFLGAGTTAAVAQQLGRRWVGIERDPGIFQTYALPRLTRVTLGMGGGFRVLELA
jgi:adenine-specific DNA-methyltransferase